ncbi:MAG: Fic family protein, partial [Casimicrobiaceae bacterium]
RAIVGHLFPRGVVGYRSAAKGRPDNGKVVLVHGNRTRRVKLPGLDLIIVPGAAAVTDGRSPDIPYTPLYLASEPRRMLENLSSGRGADERALGQEAVESELAKILSLRGEQRLNALRDQARELAPRLELEAAFKKLDSIIGALLGTHAPKKLRADDALARAAGRPYDPERSELFDVLFEALHQTTFEHLPDPARAGRAVENFAFFEAYFSNYIEGTTFTVDEAEDIVFRGRIIERRSEDSHDVLGTFQAITTAPWRSSSTTDADAFLAWLKGINALVLQSRADRNPGEWKLEPNRAGDTYFVLPELVPGTLREGFTRIQALADPLARALMAMFVVSEVHPFADGNGRAARIAMNAYLTEPGLARIIIPTVYREDYLLPLKALSQNRDPTAFIRSMKRAQRWSASFDYEQDVVELREDLAACNAFKEDVRNFRLIFPEARG